MDTTKENAMNNSIGRPLDRVEAKAKITGTARYAAEYDVNNTAYGVFVTSTIARGTILEIESQAAEKLRGVLAVMSHMNVPGIPGYFDGKDFRLFQNNKVLFSMQPVAMVIADTFEQATYAASLVKIRYSTQPHQTDIHPNLAQAVTPDRPSDYIRGQADAWENAPVKMEEEYKTALQVHNPMEPHATTAYWQGDDKLFIFNKTQGVKTTQNDFARFFNLKPENVFVHAPFVGGAFGGSSRTWPHEVAAVLGAKVTGRPVRMVLSRPQMFNMVGYRPYSIQKFAIGANTDGTITAIRHQAFGNSSRFEQFTERVVEPTKSMYNSANLQTIYKLVPLDVGTPCATRGPGETSGSFAMESAIDELAYKLQIDPLELRRRNFSDIDLHKNLPWSSNHLKECYDIGAGKFGWSKRNQTPGSMKKGEMLVGMGMSAGIYKAERAAASAGITMFADGKVLIKSSVADTGPGSATIMTQIAADALGIEGKLVSIEWADSAYPFAPPQYASHTTTSAGSAVHDAATALKKKFTDLEPSATSSIPPYKAILKKQRLAKLEATVDSKPYEENKKYSGKSFSANFVEVEVDPFTCQVRVTRVVTVIDAGTIMNHKTARSQVLGSIVWGIGIALMEEGVVDHRYGRYINNNLTDYHLPVCADIPAVDVHFIDKRDEHIDPMGAKGLGEIGLIGFTAAIANAVYHATGKRIRQLPITVDKLL